MDVDRHREAEHGPEPLGPRAGGDHELLAHGDPALVGLDGRDAVVGAELEARDLGVGVDLDALGEALVPQAGDRLEVEREAALVLVQAHGDALGAPVGEELLHVRVDLGLAEVEIGAVPDSLVALVDGGEVALLHLRPERDVADAVVVVRLGVGLPDLDARLHQLAHRGLEVVVADDAAGDPRRPRARGGLLEHDHVCTGALPALAQLDGEVVGGREAVHAGSDDDETGRSGYHVELPPGQRCVKNEQRRVPRPAPVNQLSATSPPSSAPSRWSTRSPTGRSSARTRSRAAPGSTRARSRACSRRSPPPASSSTCRRRGATGCRCASSSSGTPFWDGSTCASLARPHLQALVRETGETATLSAPGEHDAVTVDFAHSSSVVQSVAQLGRPSVGHATAAGKVMLAFGDVELPSDPLTSFTSRTIATRAELVAELERVRRRGYAEAREEREADLAAVAAPVFDSRGDLVGIVGVQGPASRFDAPGDAGSGATVARPHRCTLGRAGSAGVGQAGSQTRQAARSRIRFVSFA